MVYSRFALYLVYSVFALRAVYSHVTHAVYRREYPYTGVLRRYTAAVPRYIGQRPNTPNDLPQGRQIMPRPASLNQFQAKAATNITAHHQGKILFSHGMRWIWLMP